MGTTDETSDRELWRRAAAGDADAFARIYDRHLEPVRAFCARRSGSLDAADDLVSVVFLEAWRRRADVELVHDSALPWLYGVAARTVQRRTRTALRHRRLLTRLRHDAAGPPRASPDGPAARLVQADHADVVAARVDDERHLAQVRAALSRLGRLDQEVLLLCLWQGLDHAAAAVALQVPVGTVKSRLSRARARLQRAAADEAGHPARTGAAPSALHPDPAVQETP
ncbi:RNA polymerase sigma factor [Jannaschia sp. R86511]|uniref:RNA polymerase sigma factor n=1 Tax=Jannaschia sp. R86511 TaxID=3093853 RepID=UPI0036D25AAE